MTESEQISLVALLGEVREMRGESKTQFAVMDRRFAGLEKHMLSTDADQDGLLLSVEKLRSSIEALPCARHSERIREQTRRISELTKAVQAGETTDRIEMAKLDAERQARERIAADAEAKGRESARRWQMIAAAATVVGVLGGLGMFKLLAGCGL